MSPRSSASRLLALTTTLVCSLALIAPASVGPARASAPGSSPGSPVRPTPALGLDGTGSPLSMADPAVTPLPQVGYVAFTTGARVSRYAAERLGGPWGKLDAPAIPPDEVPAWMSRPDGSHSGSTAWAPEIVHDTAFGRDRWLLYYAAIPRPALRGGDPTFRCISVAVASDPLGDFVTPDSLQERPLRCKQGTSGVIDPSVLEVGNAAYLLYKTRSLPAQLRLARLTHSRLGIVPGTDRELVRNARTIIENPVVARFGDRFVLFASHGSFRSCGYRTDYWVSGRLHFTGPPRTLLSHDGPGRRTTVCGPGGGDVVRTPRGRMLMFHGTLVPRRGRWAPGTDDQRAVRTLYGGTLGFDHRRDRPVIRTWLTRSTSPVRRRGPDGAPARVLVSTASPLPAPAPPPEPEPARAAALGRPDLQDAAWARVRWVRLRWS